MLFDDWYNSRVITNKSIILSTRAWHIKNVYDNCLRVKEERSYHITAQPWQGSKLGVAIVNWTQINGQVYMVITSKVLAQFRNRTTILAFSSCCNTINNFISFCILSFCTINLWFWICGVIITETIFNKTCNMKWNTAEVWQKTSHYHWANNLTLGMMILLGSPQYSQHYNGKDDIEEILTN